MNHENRQMSVVTFRFLMPYKRPRYKGYLDLQDDAVQLGRHYDREDLTGCHRRDLDNPTPEVLKG